MDALQNLSTNIPDWLKRLEELSGQIQQRQIELAKFAEENQPADTSAQTVPSIKSLRNKGSTESLRPTDEPLGPHMTADDGTTPTPTPEPPASELTPTPIPAAAFEQPLAALPLSSSTELKLNTTAAPPPAVHEPSPASQLAPSPTTQQQKHELIAVAQARARAHVRKRNRSDSVISAEGAMPKYRSKSMVIVYYDSYVQSFFGELVKFVSASRNLMRKAKMAAKVAHIRRMADMELPDYGDDDATAGGELKSDDSPIIAAIPAPTTSAATPPMIPALEPAQKREGEGDGDEEGPPLKYISTRHMYANSRLGPGGAAMIRPSFARAPARGTYGGSNGLSVAAAAAAAATSGVPGGRGGGGGGITGRTSSAFDSLDKGLEFVQSMCEHAAHQFLRDGDCDEEIAKIKTRLADTNVLAAQELERKRKEGPSAEDLALQDPTKGRSYRLQTMRRESAMPGAGKKKDTPPPQPCLLPGPGPAPPHSPPPQPGLLVGSTPPRSTPPPKAPTAPVAVQPPPLTLPTGPVGEIKLEVDENLGDDDYEIMPRLVYKSTRKMMSSGVY